MQLDVTTDERLDIVDVTDRVAAAIDTVGNGTCTVFVPHTTAGITINEHEPRLLSDVEAALAALVPEDGGYDHDAIDDNADAHLRAMLVGSDVTVPIVDGRLALGTWQSILFLECDGPRSRRLRVTVTA